MKSGNRQTVRRPGQDYAGPGTYFITLCAQDRKCIFGRVINGRMYLNAVGHIVREEWLRSPEIRSEMDLDRWIVMPNHFHGIVCMAGGPWILGSFIGGFKSVTTKRINEIRQTKGIQVWQRNYDEHIIDNDQELDRIRQYIQNNPAHWTCHCDVCMGRAAASRPYNGREDGMVS